MNTVKQKYKTARALRTAIADRLKKLASETNVPYAELYRRIAFDRFLARIDWNNWTLKGGYSLQRRLPKARGTKDIDLSINDRNLLVADQTEQERALVSQLQNFARKDIDDYFSFEVTFDSPLPGFGKGGVRCQVKCMIDGVLWSTFQIDAVVQDITVFRGENITGDDFLAFAGFTPLVLTIPTKEEAFAEKIHAYTTLRPNENTRVKDLVDLVLLVNEGLDYPKLKTAILGVFQIRATHAVPIILSEAPSNWHNFFDKLAEEMNLQMNLKDAFEQVSSAFNSALK